jgi:ketosteroid isomerase-like protein
MSIYNDKTLKGVADAVQHVMDEELKGNQHKIDANKNGKVDAHDFKLLRAKKPAVVSTKKPIGVRTADIGPGNKEYNVKVKEEVEEIEEAFPTVADAHRRMGNYTKGTVTKTATGLKHERNYKDEDETEEKTGKKGKTYGANQKRRTNTKLYKESFTSMLKKLDEQGIKALDEVFAEEVEQLDELSKTTLGSYVNKASKNAAMYAADSVGMANVSSKARNPRVKAAAEKYSDESHEKRMSRLAGVGKAVKRLTKEEVETEMEQIDELAKSTLGSYIKKAAKDQSSDAYDHGEEENRRYYEGGDSESDSDSADRERRMANREKGIGRAVKKITKEEIETIEERSLTASESKKKEDIVMSMKKGLSGFKERYGKDAKSVMYATATKQAKKD